MTKQELIKHYKIRIKNLRIDIRDLKTEIELTEDFIRDLEGFKTFKDYIKRQVAEIRDMLPSLKAATINTLGYDNAEKLDRALFDAINALVDFEIILERINENKGERK